MTGTNYFKLYKDTEEKVSPERLEQTFKLSIIKTPFKHLQINFILTA